MKKNSINSYGFTLIEMAVSIIIVGILAAAFAPAYTLYVKNKRLQETEVEVKSAISAIAAYRGMYGKYPCPASLSAVAGDVDYGRESSECETPTLLIGQCSDLDGGVCAQQGTRDADGVVFASTTVEKVIVGALPFRQLNLSEGDSIDGYGNRLTYVVSENLTRSADFDARKGFVSILNKQGSTAVEPQSSAHFLVFSHGENGNGAFSRDGVIQDCDWTTDEGKNCDVKCAIDIATGASSCSVVDDAIYTISENSGAGSDEDFDDVMDFFMQDDVPLWQVSEDNANNIHQKLSGNVGFNISPTVDVGERGQISGVVRAQDDPTTTGPTDEEGRVIAKNICDYNNGDCFPPSKIAGDIAVGEGMQCGAGQHIVAVRNGGLECEDNSNIQMVCPDDRIMTGINKDGNIICGDLPPPSCDAQQFSICGEFQSTSATAHNGTYVIHGGANATATYRCVSGNWQLIGTSGSCTCTPGVVKTTKSNCGTGYSGKKTTTVTRVCPSGETEQTVDSSACTCVPTSATRNKNCPSGMNTGTIVQQHDWVCDASGNGSWTNWTTTSDTCGCTPETNTRTANCGGNLQGSYRQQQTKSCPTGSWGSWTNIDDPNVECKCVSRSQERTVSCPAGYEGEIVEGRELTCSGNNANWTSWEEKSNTCEPIPPRVCYWSSAGSSNLSGSSIGDSVGSTCDCGDKGPCYRRLSPTQYSNYTNCSCD